MWNIVITSRFIEELFKLNMLTENIMHDCIFRLLKAKDDESLLSLSILIITVGSILDTGKAKQRMDQYFALMSRIAEKCKPRVKFALKDVIELRQNNWVPRKEQPRPKKIDDIREDFYQEQEVIQFSKTQSPPSWRRRKRKSMQRQGEFLGLTIDLSSLNFSEDASESSSASTQQVSQDNILGELRMLIQDGRPNSDVQMYIKDNIPREQEEKTIVRLLITAVIKASLSTAMKLNIDILTSRQGLLQHYIKTPELELQALYAIQALMHQLEHPS
ncbi:eukaryotic translation initiation factor 4 gamma, partial [Plakobranchus ocellatus]